MIHVFVQLPSSLLCYEVLEILLCNNCADRSFLCIWSAFHSNVLTACKAHRFHTTSSLSSTHLSSPLTAYLDELVCRNRKSRARPKPQNITFCDCVRERKVMLSASVIRTFSVLSRTPCKHSNCLNSISERICGKAVFSDSWMDWPGIGP